VKFKILGGIIRRDKSKPKNESIPINGDLGHRRSLSGVGGD